MVFDGNNDYIDLSSHGSSFANFTTGFTYLGWAKWHSLNNFSRLIDFSNGPTSDNILITNVNDSKTLRFGIYQNGAEHKHNIDNYITLNQWIHVAVTVDENHKVVIYKNGSKVYGPVTSSRHIVNVARTKAYIGKSAWSANDYFDGEMDDIRIYNTALSVEEIQFRYQNPTD